MESRITNYVENCVICGSKNVVTHHLIYGTANHRLCDEDKLLLPICPKHHNMDSKESVHLNPAIGKWSKIVGQLAYEKHLVAQGMTEEEARMAFLKRYGEKFL